MSDHAPVGFHGPKCWILSTLAGLAAGFIVSLVAPAPAPHGQGLLIPVWLLLPFALLLISIALMPFINVHFWEHHFPDFAFFLGSLTVGYYLPAFGQFGRTGMSHAALEYLQFIALIGSLYVVSGGVLVDLKGRGSPALNTALLGFGAVIANLIGTTGASMLLIRPFLRINNGRIHGIHIAMFIMIVSNCGGCLTPVGDPPLFLGYLKGVPFVWTLFNLWPAWLFVNATLLAIFFVIDSRYKSSGDAPAEPTSLSIKGKLSLVFLAVLIGSVLLDAWLKQVLHMEHFPFGAILQALTAVLAYKTASREILERNGFNFHPVKEVGFLFAGIFAAMVPALAYLEQNAGSLGLKSPTQFYFVTGSLSAVLDNAPTYLSFLQTAFGVVGLELQPPQVHQFIGGTFTIGGAETSGRALLSAISLGSVLFGAMTYIGNGPNFMVKAIAQTSGAEAPSFFGYIAYAAIVLLPVLVAAWAIFLR